MKAMKKVLALGLALAMVVTAVPVTNAQAATGVASKKTYAAGKTYTLKLTPPSTWKSISTKWSTSNKAVAKLSSSAKKSVKVEAVKKGTATVTAKVTNTKTNKAKTYKCAVTVKNPGVRLAAAPTVIVGEKLNVVEKTWPKSATVTYKSSDDAIATVDANGEVTGVKTGKATITATMTCGTKVFDRTTEVTVKTYELQSVSQTKADELGAVILGETKDIKGTDIRVVNTETKVVYPVKSVTPSPADKTKVTIELFSDLIDAKTYEVTLDGVTKSFVASDGKVAGISVDPVTIPYATDTEIKLIAKDTNGVILKELPYTNYDANYDFIISTNGTGYTIGSKLHLDKVGDTATAEITYKTLQYDQNGQPVGNIGPVKVTITAVDQTAINNFDARIDTTGVAGSYEKTKDNKLIPAGETRTAYFKIKDANGKDVDASDYAKYTVESSDKNTMMLSSSVITTGSVQVTGLKQGTAHILIKNLTGAIVGSIEITVGAPRTVETLELDKYSVAVSKKLPKPQTVTVTLKDQYGDEIERSFEVVNLNKPVGAADPVQASSTVTSGYAYLVSGSSVTFTSDAAMGIYVYKVSYKDWTTGKEVAKTVTVNIQDTNATTVDSYRLDVDKSTLDLNVRSAADAVEKTINVSMIGQVGGVDYKAITGASFVVTTANGKVIYDPAKSIEPDWVEVTNGALTIKATTTTGSTIVEKHLEGDTTYVVTATATVDTKNVVRTTTFNIKDTQTKPVVVYKDIRDVAVGTGAAVSVQSAIVDAIRVLTYNGQAQDVTIASVKFKVNNTGTEYTDKDMEIASGNYFNVSELKVRIQVATGVYVDMAITPPYTITVK